MERLCRGFARCGLARSDAVVAVGGGVVSDVAGFAAAVFHRGIAYVNVATTLLAQVDAAIGGKTGVNLPEGKNLVGAFWQPAAVLCDIETLGIAPGARMVVGARRDGQVRLPGRRARSTSAAPVPASSALPLDEQVAACVAIKAAVVTERRARVGPAHGPQLRPHPGPRPRGGRLRSRREMGPPPR